jgi:chromosome segregation ATPase
VIPDEQRFGGDDVLAIDGASPRNGRRPGMRTALRYLSMCACIVWLTPGPGALRAQEHEELRAHWEKLGAKMEETEARIGRLEEKRDEIGDRNPDAAHEVERAIEEELRRLEELERERHAVAERLEAPARDRGPREEFRARVREIDREVAELKEHIHNLSRELEEVGGERTDHGHEIIREIEKVKGRIGELMEKRGHLLRELEGPPPERRPEFEGELGEMERRMHLMRRAAELLREAGAGELAEAANHRAGELERELRGAMEAREREAHERRQGPEHREGPPVEHIQRSVEELRGEVAELREMIRGLHERLERAIDPRL